MILNNKLSDFVFFLKKEGLSPRTIHAYGSTVYYYLQHYGNALQINDLMAYRGVLSSKYKPKTVNLRIQAINRYLSFVGMPELHLRFIKIQSKHTLENVISDADYRFLKRKLFEDHNEDLAMAVWFLGATGARVSELLQIKVEHVQCGYIDLLTKGGKIRRIYIPQHLIIEAKRWLQNKKIISGYIFLNHDRQRITSRGLAQKLQIAAQKYHLDKKVVHPHSFRHRFAKNFLEKYQDIALLADLMGHDSIETTRIYLRRTSTEQQALVNRIIDW